MFIRKTVSKNKNNVDEKYYTYRLVESYRVGNLVKQRVLLNLGADFNVDKSNWFILATRIEDIIKQRISLFEINNNNELESLAQQYALRIISLQAQQDTQANNADYQDVDINSIENINPKTIGAEYLVYEAIKELELPNLFDTLKFTPIATQCAIGTLIAKACSPLSDKMSIEWLRDTSGAGEFYNCDYNDISDNSFYRAADILLSHKETIEQHLYNKAKQIFGFDETITLYDLTNTYFEGKANTIEKAKRGRSKEKRSDAKIITLAVVLDSSGFIKNSKIFSGNISEPTTLQAMIDDLKIQITKDENNQTIFKTNTKSLVVMDAGIASEANIEYLKNNNYEYLVVSRKQNKQFDEEQATMVKFDKDNNCIVRAQKVEIRDENNIIKEVELYCHSTQKEKKEDSMQERVQTEFIQSLEYLRDGLVLPKRTKLYDKVLEKIGALKSRYATIAKYYDVTVKKDPNSSNALSLSWNEKIGTDDISAMNGIYCLRTNNTTMDETTLWKTYTTLTDLESVFRTLKTELGLRPIYHKTQKRVDAHLFITTLAYTIIHTIRYKLKAHNINYRWSTIREIVSPQVRITTTANIKDGRVLYVRQSSLLSNEKQKEIYDVLKLNHKAGAKTKIYK
ncbi:MAG: IS1634 family transposase [Epsilonproteobacteria bacterium]|nr:IS1634 family transposase [Campylobacterota bacterium]